MTETLFFILVISIGSGWYLSNDEVERCVDDLSESASKTSPAIRPEVFAYNLCQFPTWLDRVMGRERIYRAIRRGWK